MERMMVQVDPSVEVSTSIRPPLLATPTAAGASLYLVPSWERTSSRSLHGMDPAKACAGKATRVTAIKDFHMTVLLCRLPESNIRSLADRCESTALAVN